MNTFTKAFKVNGAEGHRQKESFNPSYMYNFSNENGTRIIEVFNHDLTGTNQYTVVRITRDTEDLCINEIEGQLSDGIFENKATGSVEDVTEEYSFDKVPALDETWKVESDARLYSEYLGEKLDFACLGAAKKYYGHPEAMNIDELNEALKTEYDGMVAPVIIRKEL